ncbi:MAG TPA: AAA family ATPase [Nevskiaceae bacterium]|nr:AAA family ATPase [Nevskiaceae bacterium]
MTDIVLHAHTASQLEQFIAQPAHAVLLTGADGIGKATLAAYLAAQILELPADKLAQYQYAKLLGAQRGTIPIESIRELTHFLQLKTIGTKPLRRVIIAEHAQGLTLEAQNAFLKLLEEPPSDTIIILTADTPRALLPTIRSRLQTIAVNAPPEAELKKHFASAGNDETAIARGYFLSGGLPGLMHALLADDTAHPLLKSVAVAKELLGQPVFERLAKVDSLSKQKEEATHVLQALQHIAQTGLDQAAGKSDAARIKQWHRVLKHTFAAQTAMQYSVNTKLALTNLMLHM